MKSGDILGGKYRLEQKIGKGAMGAVWSAENTTTGGKFALKMILPQDQQHRTDDLRQRLMREARACGKLNHRNIVKIYDIGETPAGEPFLVMELLHGQTLGELLKEKRRLEPALAARILGEVASGLAVAHAAQVIHRDLKPDNIFLHHEEGTPEEAFVPKVVDFGIAKSLDSVDAVATQTGIAVGSPAYMSPEQVAYRKDLDGATDVWSLGIVLYELLTGARPFTGSVAEVSRLVLMTSINPVPAPSNKVRGISPEFDAIVARCTAPTRTDRYPNAAVLSQALLALAETSRSARIPISIPTPPTLSADAQSAGMASTSPLAGPPRIPTWTGGDAAATPAPRAAMGSVSEASELRDLVATIPMQPQVLAAMRPAQAQPADQGAAGTQILDRNQPIASPGPQWRKEMQQAIAAHRQSSANLEAVVPSQASNGETQMITPELQAGLAGNADPSGTTSGAGALSHPSARIPVPAGLQPDPAVTTGRRKRSKGILFGVMGAGVVAAIGVIGLLVVNVSKLEGEDKKVPEITPQAMNSAAVAPVETVPVVASAQTPPQPPTQEAAPTATTELPRPPVTAENTVAQPPPPPPTTTTASPPNKQPWPNKKAPTSGTPNCTGVGLFKKCKPGSYNPNAP